MASTRASGTTTMHYGSMCELVLLQWAFVRQVPSSDHLAVRIMLLSVVSMWAATSCHQIQSRQVNPGSVICRSVHSTTSNLVRLSSQRLDLKEQGPIGLAP
ncbi:hypothetical protein Pden_1055 [Paracoccus denitrificans PD1222]|jgi:hypothetical protein|uniref:Uncharacterized protein n=1 Tax=Paracoccus denitrificans (strain Pd 1222) TaxID=318586 RepID=A1B0X0_PARDP|nr:hypothetical protein Pden_1055 [Paracoccus denitrificans PD1222]